MSTPESHQSTAERKLKLAPSILSADFGRLAAQVAEAEAAGADLIHVDVMDGLFVPNITVGPMVVKAVRRATSLPLDVHLMVERPEDHLQAFAQAGANLLTVHVETGRHLHRLLESIHQLGVRAGVALNPATPVCTLEEIIPFADMVLVMTVNPGFGGQSFIEPMLDKIARVRALVDRRRPECEVEVDGGVNPTTIARIASAGVDIAVAGAAVFDAGESVGQAIARLRRQAAGRNE